MRILYVVHNVPPYEHTGTPLVAMQYAELALRAGHVAGIAFAANPASGPEPTLREDGLHLFPIRGSRSMAKLRGFRPDIIHIVDRIYLPASLPRFVKSIGVPVIRHICNMEDVCAFISPIEFYADGHPCKGPLTVGQCSKCAAQRKSGWAEWHQLRHSVKVRARWTTFRRHLRDLYSELVFMCDSTRSYFESIFDLGDVRRSVITHGIVPPRSNPPLPERLRDGAIRFVFLGPCVERKGWNAIAASFERLLLESERIRLIVYGGDAAASARLFQSPRAELRGSFPANELDAVLTSADVGLVPSTFETFCRACYEMLGRGIPVIGSDAFGIRDIVEHRRNGLQIGWPTAEAVEHAVRLLLDQPDLLERLKAGARETAIVSADDEFRRLVALYESHLAAGRS